MKILLHLNNPFGMGADRWVTSGYKDAFEDLGHIVRYYTEKDNLHSVVEEFHPDIFVTNIEVLRMESGAEEYMKQMRKAGCYIFFNAGEDYMLREDIFKRFIKEGVVDTYYAIYAPESMGNFEEEIGFPLLYLPLAANKKLHFPSAPDPRFAADISFVGARLATKEHLFKSVLLPLTKKYNVAIYGAGWTMKDKILRLMSGFGRRFKVFPVADWANKRRVSISLEDERLVYASSKICVNFHEYNEDGTCKNLSNEREFKVPACGGFEISDAIIGIEHYFVPDKEIVLARTPEEWHSKIAYYMSHDREREAIRSAGYERVKREHYYSHRVDTMLKAYAGNKSI
jgi:hypothetical protein